MYIPFFCAENILTDIMRKNGFDSLGFMLLAVLYLFQMVGSFFGPSVVKVLGLKWSFVIGCFTLSAFVFIQILPAWRQDRHPDDLPPEKQSFFERRGVVIFFLYLANVISGSGTAVLWTA